jgi:hypothetical protein
MNIKQLNKQAVRKSADQKKYAMECSWFYHLVDIF